MLTDGDCTEVSDCFAIEAMSTVNMDAPEIQLYPVPAIDQLHVMWSGSKSHYAIYSMDGRMWLEGQLSPGQNSVNVSVLENGQYFLRTARHTERFSVIN
jgi:hypothetical protein